MDLDELERLRDARNRHICLVKDAAKRESGMADLWKITNDFSAADARYRKAAADNADELLSLARDGERWREARANKKDRQPAEADERPS